MPLESLQNGRYRIVRPLGSGSMGEVYLVEDTRIDRQVAIKVIRLDASSYMNKEATQDAIRLFDREAKSIAQLNHRNILPLFDYGEEVVNGATVTYMVMPYCPDGSLATWLQQHAQTDMLSPQDTIHFARQAADALQHAHDHDIIHQDVKPSNFLIRSRNAGLPDILLADFGIAKLAASSSGASHVVRGTPIYMAPEQWEGHPVPASDQYALAVMVYQLLTGRTPFQGGPSQMMYQHITVSPMPPSTVNTGLSPAVDTVLLRALAKRPRERFPTVAAFADALQQTLPTIDHPTVVNAMGREPFDDNRPTMMSGANLARGEAIRATLAISTEEAATGTRRALTLPNGQRVTIFVPSGVQNGQVLRIGEEDGTLIDGNLAEPLLLTITIAPTYKNTANIATIPAREDGTIINADPALLANANQPTVQNMAFNTLSSQPTVRQQQYPLVAAQGNQGQFGPPVQPRTPQQTQPRKPSRGRFIVLVAIVLIILLASTGFLIYFLAGNATRNTANANATATAQANAALAGTNTALAQANQTGTAQVGNNNATATANANATAIGIANVHATATAGAAATATAQANATATANAQNNANATATAQAGVNATATAQGNINATATAIATAHPVISNGTGTIQGTFEFSFDSGAQVSNNGDVWWDQIDTIQRQMAPVGSATIVNLGNVDFNGLDFTTLQGESYGTTPIDGNNDSTNQLVNGDVFAVHTNGGNYAKVMVVNYGYNIQIQWVTYHG